MPYIEAQNGGGLSSTELWRNPNSSAEFAGQTVTLSDSITNYEKLRILWDYSTTSGPACSIDVDVDKFIANGTIDDLYKPKVFLGVRGQTYSLVRPVFYKSATQVQFGVTQRVGSSGISNTNVIPYTICGLK